MNSDLSYTARLREVVERCLLESHQQTPENTRRAYTPKQKEWKLWCQRKGFASIPEGWPELYVPGRPLPDDLVDEGKLLLFMADEVVSRAPRTGSRVAQERRKRREAGAAGGVAKRKKKLQDHGQDEDEVPAADSGDEEGSFESSLKLQYNTVRSYVSAIQKLYDIQRTRGMNPAPRPQGVALKAMQKSILRTTWARKRSEYADRGENTIKDSYTPSQILVHTSAVWNEPKQIACALRTQVDFLLGNHMLLRSSNRRPLEFPDCFCLKLPKEGIK
ncbi:hypothetical protein N657DRAFT_584317, partial [Parathielavia appendiculata]